MGDLVKPQNTIVVVGTPLHVEKKITTVATMYPGRLVRKDASDGAIKISGAADSCTLGWLGYEQCHPNHQPATVDTIYAVNAFAPVLYGGGFVIVARLANGQNITMGRPVESAADGEVTEHGLNDDVRQVGIALESVNASGGAADIMVLSLI